MTARKRGPGRPPFPAKLRRTYIARVPLNAEERRSYRLLAKRRGMSLSECIRETMDAAVAAERGV